MATPVLEQVGARCQSQVLKVAARCRAANIVVLWFDGGNHGRHGSLQPAARGGLVETEGTVYLPK